MASVKSEEYYNQIMSRSCNGNRTRNESRTEHVDKSIVVGKKKRYRINVKRFMIACTLAGVLTFSAGAYTVNTVVPHISESLQVSQELGSDTHDFREQYIVPNTYRTQDANHYLFYDYEGIAEGLDTFGDGDFDENLYYCLESIDSKNVDEVLGVYKDENGDYKYRYSITDTDGQVHSRNFRYYLAENGYYGDTEVTQEVLLHDDKAYEKAIDNFRDDIKQKQADKLKAASIVDEAFASTEKAYNDNVDDLNSMLADDEVTTVAEKGVKR